MAGPALLALALGGPEVTWAPVGLRFDRGTAQVGATLLQLVGGGPGLTGWTLRGEAGPDVVDGIATVWARERAADDGGAPPARHPLGAMAVDHVVVASPDVARTTAALQAVGMVVRREGRGGSDERPLRQVFFRHGEAVVELVGPAEADGDGPATLWGLTLVVADLDAAVAHLGPLAGAPRDAVQPGRRIVTVRREAGLGVPLALMDAA